MKSYISLARRNRRSLAISATALAFAAPPVWAQNTGTPSTQERSGGAAAALSEDIVVTATKRPEDVQNVPLAVTAFGEQQLQALNFRNLGSLGYSMPNVQLNDNGSQPGYQNFSIRGLGINSSIPSIDPTVGVFVDGVYQGINAGILAGQFDIEAIEVLRGPQGVLFGRNVTGGAIIVRTKKPADTLTMNAGLSFESREKITADATVWGRLLTAC